MNAKINAIEQHMHRRIQDTVYQLNRGRLWISLSAKTLPVLSVATTAIGFVRIQNMLSTLYCSGPGQEIMAMHITTIFPLIISATFTLGPALWDFRIRQVEQNMILAANELTAYLLGREAQKTSREHNPNRTPTYP